MILIKETFYLIKVGQSYVNNIEGEYVRTGGFMGKTEFEWDSVVLTPHLNEAMLFTKDDTYYLDYCHIAAMTRAKVIRMEQVA